MNSRTIAAPMGARPADERAPLLDGKTSSRGSIFPVSVAGVMLGVAAVAAVSAASSGLLSTDSLGIKWSYARSRPGQDPVITTDSGAMQGTCDAKICTMGDHTIGEYAYVDNCLDGGAGCMVDSDQSGCRLCTIEEPGPPTWFPPCPRCVCSAFGVTDEGTMCEPPSPEERRENRREKRRNRREHRRENTERAEEDDEEVYPPVAAPTPEPEPTVYPPVAAPTPSATPTATALPATEVYPPVAAPTPSATPAATATPTPAVYPPVAAPTPTATATTASTATRT